MENLFAQNKNKKAFLMFR